VRVVEWGSQQFYSLTMTPRVYAQPAMP
jgi:hypothetical protein